MVLLNIEQFVEQMAEIVRKGIEQANQDLEKESESRLMQEVSVTL